MKALQLLQPIPLTIYTAQGHTRTVSVNGAGQVTVTVRWARWLTWSKDRKEGRPRAVTFPLWAIAGGEYRPRTWWRRGRLLLNVPAANDPWARRTERHRKRKQMPPTRPHKIHFGKRRQPYFVVLAEQIGMELPEVQS